MKYSIISLNDERLVYKNGIRERVRFEEVHIPAVDGNYIDSHAECAARGLSIDPEWKNVRLGEIGVWLSNFDQWQYIAAQDRGVIVFEDDAIPSLEFHNRLDTFRAELPTEWDYCALWVPPDQLIDYTYRMVGYDNDRMIVDGRWPYNMSGFHWDEHAAYLYQGYGQVALMYSPEGAQKLIDLAREQPLRMPVDCFTHQQAHLDKVLAFAPTPKHADIIEYDGRAFSHVHNTQEVIF